MSYQSLRKALAALALIGGSFALASAAQAAELPRSHISLTSAISVDVDAQTVTLPLFRGTAHGKTVWYIVTDSSDIEDAQKRGVNAAPVLAQLEPFGIQAVHAAANGLVFSGAPEFAPKRSYVLGSTGFPPTSAAPGATADAEYSPFIRIDASKIVLNAPIVATGEGPFDVSTHANTQDRVLAVDTKAKTVTLLLARGFAGGKAVVYLSTEASDPGASSIERATYVPKLAKIERGTIPIFVVANGREQGLGYTALHGLERDATLADTRALRSPLNVLATFPLGPARGAYSPLWTANIGAWTPAVAGKSDTVLTSPSAFIAAVAAGHFTAPDGKAFGPSGILVNCPVVAYVDEAP